MSQTAGLVLLAFTVKVVAIVSWAHVLRRMLGSLLESLIAACVSVQLALVAGLVVLSPFHAVRGPAVWCLLVAVGLSGIWAAARAEPLLLSAGDWKTLASREAMVAWLGLLAVFGFLAFRSFVFSDNTWDAVTYELPRIAFWAKHHTLFVYQPTDAINIFGNEWNGELNALLYVTAAGNEVAAAFGNVDVWLFGCTSLAWLARIFGAPARMALLCGLVLATTPLLLGLAMTVKGDLLAAAATCAAVGVVLEHLRTARVGLWRPAIALAAMGLAAGSKIVVLPTAVALAAAFVWEGFRLRRDGSVGVLAIGLAGFAVGCARYAINGIQFGHWFLRAEESHVGLGTLTGNLRGILAGSFEIVSSGANPPYFWVLSAGLGALGVALALWVAVWLGARHAVPLGAAVHERGPFRSATGLFWLIAFPLSAGLGAALVGIPWWPWSLRYFSPWLLILLAWLLALPFQSFPGRLVGASLTFWMLTIGANLWLALGRPGESLPLPFAEALQRPHTERQFAVFPYFYAGDSGLEGIVFGTPRALRVLVSNRMDSPLYPFFGENYRHDVELVDTTVRLTARISATPYDLVVFSGVPRDDEPHVRALLEQREYLIRVDSPLWRVYGPRFERSALSRP